MHFKNRSKDKERIKTPIDRLVHYNHHVLFIVSEKNSIIETDILFLLF